MANARKFNPNQDYFPGENDDPTRNLRVDPNAFPKQSDAANVNEREHIWVEPDLDRMSDEEKSDVWARYSADAAADPRLDSGAHESVWSNYESEAGAGSMFDANSQPRRKSRKGLWLTGGAAALVIAGIAMAVTANNPAPQRETSATEQALKSGDVGAAGLATNPSLANPAQPGMESSAAIGGASASTAPVTTANAGMDSATAAPVEPAAAKPAAKPAAPAAKVNPAAETATVPETADGDLDGALPPTYWQGAPNPAGAQPSVAPGATPAAPAAETTPTPSEALPPLAPSAPSSDLSAPPADTPPAAATTPGAMNLTPSGPAAPATGSLEPAPVPGTPQFDATSPAPTPSGEPAPQ